MAVLVLTALATYRTLSANWMRVSAVSVTSCVKPLVGISPGAVGVDVSSGGGALKPPDGISPASVGTEKTHVKATATRNRFIEVFSFEFVMMQEFLH